MRLSIMCVAAMAFAALASCASMIPAPDNDEHAIISAYTEAYNDRDVAAMSALMHPDIQWLAIEGDKVEIYADGKADLIAQMTDYVASPAATTSSLGTPIADGPYLAVRETARWSQTDGTPAEQSALAVYEISGGLILRVWYYPATQ